MKLKTSELTGEALDWAVAKCEGGGAAYVNTHSRGEVLMLSDDIHPWSRGDTWGPSYNWSQGGPIIEREGITIEYEGDPQKWCACIMADQEVYGPTALIAAMRCYVAFKFGDEVEVPEELCATTN